MNYEDNEPCTDTACEVQACIDKRAQQGKTLEDLREEFGANSIEYYRKQADSLDEALTVVKLDRDAFKNMAERSEQRHQNRDIALKNFETSLRELLEADSERVSWDDLERPLRELGIELTQEWQAWVSISAKVTLNALTREGAESLLNQFRTWEVEINNSDFETHSVEEIDWSDLEEADN